MRRHPAISMFASTLVSSMLFAVTTEAGADNTLDRTGRQWAPFLEWTVKNPEYTGNPFDVIATATFTHVQSGEKRTTGMFYSGGGVWKFRFTGTRPGRWKFTTFSKQKRLNGLQGVVMIQPNHSGYGFVIGVKDKWARQRGVEGKPDAFVPQIVMYGHPKTFYRKPKQIDADIKTFITQHGFTGFHVPVFCRLVRHES